MKRTPSGRKAFLDALNTVAVTISQTLGFEIATIAIAFEDTLETFAVAGPEDVRTQMLRHQVPIAVVEKELSNAERWGDLRFVPHDRVRRSLKSVGSPVPEMDARTDDPGAWQPLDLLVAPLRDHDGRLRGVVSVDRPRDGRRPTAEALEMLHHQVAVVQRTVLYALERVELDEQIRMTQAVRKVVREASSELSVDAIIAYSQEALTQTFDAYGLWIQTFDDTGDGSGAIFSSNGSDIHLREELRQVARPAARMLWKYQGVAVIAESLPRTPVMTPEQEQQVFEFMRSIDVTSMLFVPLGAGQECLGNLVLTRRGGRSTWTDLEKRTALDIGHDLGRALLNARSFERERRVVDELRELDIYKSRLIATLAHELKNPLTAVLGHTEMLGAFDLEGPAKGSVQAVERGAARMQRLVDDLLALAKAGDPQTAFSPKPVDLRAIVDDVVDLLQVSIDRKELSVEVYAPEGPLYAMGDPDGLDQVISNLVSNAAKYTPEGGRITVEITLEDSDVVCRVSDTGLGISDDDQEKLFQEFFRSTNPAAVALPGTGLGLAITKRIVERHGGTIDCQSVLGQGTTFTFTVPTVAA